MKISELYLLVLLLTFSLPYLVWRLGRTEYFAPLVVVQILTGIVLGPGLLGAYLPGVYRTLFQATVLAALNGTAWWAIILFVWGAGVELDLHAIWEHRRDTVITAGLALGMPLLFGAVASVGLLYEGSFAGPGAKPWQFVLAVGMSCAVSALPILALFLQRLELLRLPLGQRVLRYASLDDIAVWLVLAFILVDLQKITRQILFLGLFALAAAGVRRLMRALSAASDRWYVSLIWLVGIAFLADWSGLHFIVGAYLAGAVLDASFFDRQRLDQFRNSVLLALMPIFFLSTGLKTTWHLHSVAVLGAAGVLLLASVGGKLAGTQLASRILGWGPSEGYVIGWLLQTKALIVIIFADILLEKRILTSQAFTAVLLMAVGSTMLTVPCVDARLARLLPARKSAGLPAVLG